MMEEYTTGTGQKMFVHNEEECRGHCCIHNPSDHHMVDWPTNWRGDRQMMERICKHGVGHPDPDSLDYQRHQMWLAGGTGDYIGVHGCDGCCMKEDTDE